MNGISFLDWILAGGSLTAAGIVGAWLLAWAFDAISHRDEDRS